MKTVTAYGILSKTKKGAGYMAFVIILGLILLSLCLVYFMSVELVEFALHMRRKGTSKTVEAPDNTPRNKHPGFLRAHEWYEEKEQQNAFFEEAYRWILNETPQQLQIRSKEGLCLKADLYRRPDARGTALLLPGWTDVKEYLYAETKLLYDCGMNVLVVDERAHGSSEGEFTTFGAKESEDAWQWIALLKKMGFDKLMVMGRSMGAATAMLTAARDTDHTLLCAIEDSGFTSMRDEMSYFVRSRARWVPPFLYPLLSQISAPVIRRKAGFRVSDASPIDGLQTCRVPMLFIHGESDTFVPFDMMADLVNAHPGPKASMSVPGAGHVNSLLTDTPRYQKTVQDFINQYY